MAGAESTTLLLHLTTDQTPPSESLPMEVHFPVLPLLPHLSPACDSIADMGCGEIDGSYREQLYNPSINTTDRLLEELYRTDFFMHIGDMSYAQGYAAIVSDTFHHIFALACTGSFTRLCSGMPSLPPPLLSLLCSGTRSLTSWGTLLLQNPTWCALETTRETHQTQCKAYHILPFSQLTRPILN